MDIKRRRREAGMERRQIDDNYPGVPPGAYGQGSAASDQNPFWWARAQSWSEGADTDYLAIQQEGEREHQRWGTPWRDHNPGPQGPQAQEDPLGFALQEEKERATEASQGYYPLRQYKPTEHAAAVQPPSPEFAKDLKFATAFQAATKKKGK